MSYHLSILCLKQLFFLSLLTVFVAPLKNNLECEDTSKECEQFQEKCRDARHSWLVKLKCPKSCDACEIVEKKKTVPKEEKCKDVYTNCDKYLDNCKIEKFKKLMTEFCPRTCSFCKPEKKKEKTKCRDSIYHCDELILHGFCNNTALTSKQKRDICGESCQFCS